MGLKRWAIPSFPASGTEYLLVEGTEGQDTVIISMQVYNNSSNIADIEFRFTDGVDTQNYFVITKDAKESPTIIDSVIVIEPDDEVWCKSNQVECNIRVNGEVR
jgi:hypothetical protein